MYPRCTYMSSSALIPSGMGLSIHCGTTPLLLKAGILSYVGAILIIEVPFRTAEVHSIAPQCNQALYIPISLWTYIRMGMRLTKNMARVTTL